MANKTVTKKLTTTRGTALLFDVVSEEGRQIDFDFEGKLTDKQICKRIEAEYSDKNMKLLKLKNVDNGQRVYAMDLNEFLANAYIVNNEEE